MSDYYETLGVPKSASGEEIKKAFRRKAKATHPDREGGDARAMALINKAYETLSDPAKREYYDTHQGEEAPINTFEQRALQAIYQMLMTLTEQVGESFNFVHALRENFGHNRGTLQDKRRKFERDIKKAEKQRKCIKHKQGKNLLDQLFQQKIDALRAEIEKTDELIALAARALEILEEYESTVEGTSHFSPQGPLSGSIFGHMDEVMRQFKQQGFK